MTTNVRGQVFVSYRRERLVEVRELVAGLRSRGVPTWLDLDQLGAVQTEAEIRRVLESPDTSGVLFWLTSGASQSAIIQNVEVPGASARTKESDGFFLAVAPAGGATYEEVDTLMGPHRGSVSFSSRNVWRVTNDPASHGDIATVCRKCLDERLQAIRNYGNHDGLRLFVAGRGSTLPDDSFDLLVDWRPIYGGKAPDSFGWNLIRESIDDIALGIKSMVPGRHIEIEGTPSIPAATLIGSRFSARDGVVPTWRQRSPDGLSTVPWASSAATGASVARDLGWAASLEFQDASATELAVCINGTESVLGAFRRSERNTPSWRAILAVDAPRGRDLRQSPMAPDEGVALAWLVVDEIRRARTTLGSVAGVHIFAAVPAGVAYFVGVHLATLPPVSTYEFDREAQDYRLAVEVRE